jgi:SPX domain protein involved in polyphosphate accumulation
MENISYRYERKFVTDTLRFDEITKLIRTHKAHFRKIYPDRYVNNIYFDTHLLDNYQDSLCGVRDRRKVRIRWYHNFLGQLENPQLEIKSKQGVLGYKIRHELADFELQKGVNAQLLRDRLVQSNPPRLFSLNMQIPILANRYHRSYWLSADSKFRLTLDSRIEYHLIKKFNNQFMIPCQDQQIIAEIKYAQEDNDLASGITKHLPLRMGRMSKYMSGIELCHPDNRHIERYMSGS